MQQYLNIIPSVFARVKLLFNENEKAQLESCLGKG
jgi:hypothetical protein